MSGHTPGPWEVELDPEGGFIITNGSASTDGTWVLASRVPISHRAAESHANGHLIAAAPVMYEALGRIFDCHTCDAKEQGAECEVCAVIDAAIAKAQGQ